MIILFGIALAVLYFGLFYTAPAAENVAAAPTGSPPNVKVIRPLLLGVFLFFALDGAVFHSGLYERILKPKSSAGLTLDRLRAEISRPSSNPTEVLVLGDSRIGAAFAPKLANRIADAQSVSFAICSIGASRPRLWYYFLREVDPRASRYDMIVLPIKPEGIDFSGNPTDDASEIVQIAPLLRYTDAYSYASSFDLWRNRCKAFTACILRGTAFQLDLFDLFKDPAARASELRQTHRWLNSEFRQRRNADVAGVFFDTKTNKLGKFPARLAKRQKRSIRESLTLLERDPRPEANSYKWSKRIAERYARSSTQIVFVPMPRSPLASVVRPPSDRWEVAPESWLGQKAVLLDNREWEFLETPEYFVDGFHLNANGQRQFTACLTKQLLARLETSNLNRDDRPPANLSER